MGSRVDLVKNKVVDGGDGRGRVQAKNVDEGWQLECGPTEPGTKISRRDCVLVEHALEVIAGALAASEGTTCEICE